MLKLENLGKWIVWSFGLTLIIHRASNEVGRVFFVVGLLLFLYLLHFERKNSNSRYRLRKIC